MKKGFYFRCMKGLSLILFLFITGSVFAQFIKPNNSYGTIMNRLRPDSTLFVPTGCGVPSGFIGLRSVNQRMAAIYYDSCGKQVYLFSPKDTTWQAVGLGDTTAVAPVIDSTGNVSFRVLYAQGGKIVGNARMTYDTTFNTLKLGPPGGSFSSTDRLTVNGGAYVDELRLGTPLVKTDTTLYKPLVVWAAAENKVHSLNRWPVVNDPAKLDSITRSNDTVYQWRNAIRRFAFKDSTGGSGADSSVFATNYRLDTVKANLRGEIGQKLNISDTATMLAPYALEAQIPAQFNPIAGTNITLSGSYPNITFNAAGGLVADSVILNRSTFQDKQFNIRTGRLDSLFARGSGGFHLVSNSGTSIANFGGGGGSNATFSGFAGYDANRAAGYTARSFTDKNYVDSINSRIGITATNRSILFNQNGVITGNDSVRVFKHPEGAGGIQLGTAGLYQNRFNNALVSTAGAVFPTLSATNSFGSGTLATFTGAINMLNGSTTTFQQGSRVFVQQAIVFENRTELRNKFRFSGQGIKIGDNIDTTSAAASAILELEDVTRGFALPRMTNTQRDAIASPLQSLQVFSTTDSSIYLRLGSGGGWRRIIHDGTLQSVGIGTATPAASSILDLTSTNAGLLIPRMTSTQRNAISSPATGLQVYNTSDSAVQTYNGAFWGVERIIYKNNATTVSASTTLIPDPELQVSLEAGAYRVELNFVTNISGGGWRYNITGPSLSTWSGTQNIGGGGIGNPQLLLQRNSATSTGTATTTGANNMAGYHSFVWQCDTAGTLQINWAQNTASGTATIFEGSFLKVTRIK